MPVCCFSKAEVPLLHILLFLIVAVILSVPLIIVVRRQPCKVLKFSSHVTYEVNGGRVVIKATTPTEFTTHKLTLVFMYLWKNQKYCYVDARTIHRRHGTFITGEHVTVNLTLPCRGDHFLLKIHPESYYRKMRSYCHRSHNRQCSITCPNYISKFVSLGESHQERCYDLYSTSESCAMHLRHIPVKILPKTTTSMPSTTPLVNDVRKRSSTLEWGNFSNISSYNVGELSEHRPSIAGWIIPISIVVMFLVIIIMLVVVVHKILIQRSVKKLSKTENNLENITRFHRLVVPPIKVDFDDLDSNFDSLENQSINTCNDLDDFP